MDEPLKVLLRVVVVVLIAVALIAFINGGTFISAITAKIMEAIDKITF